jgi:hypothetical protein
MLNWFHKTRSEDVVVTVRVNPAGQVAASVECPEPRSDAEFNEVANRAANAVFLLSDGQFIHLLRAAVGRDTANLGPSVLARISAMVSQSAPEYPDVGNDVLVVSPSQAFAPRAPRRQDD